VFFKNDLRFWIVVQFRNFDASNVDVIVAEQATGIENSAVILPVQLDALDVTHVEGIDEQQERVCSMNKLLAIPNYRMMIRTIRNCILRQFS
jgi:hypothetical protein